MTRKHYIKIGQAIKDSMTYDAYGDEIIHKDDLINDLCVIFKNDNSNFNTSRFIDFINDVD